LGLPEHQGLKPFRFGQLNVAAEAATHKEIQKIEVTVAPTFRLASWFRADARLKAGATRAKTAAADRV
jgi:hypothetical protein